MKPRFFIGVATVLGLLLMTPCMSSAQEATIMATATVLAPDEAPSVRLVGAEHTVGGRPFMMVEGEQSWGVRITVADREFVFSPGAIEEERFDLPSVVWSSLRRSGARKAPIRVVLAAY